MFLEDACLGYVNSLLYVQVQYGWGWGRIEPDTPPWTREEAAGPPDFHVRVRRFYQWRLQLRGAVGVIESPGHPYDRFWLACYTRSTGPQNFTTRPAYYNLLIGPEEPVMGDPAEDPTWAHKWPIWHLTGSPQVAGYGMIAEGPECFRALTDQVTSTNG